MKPESETELSTQIKQLNTVVTKIYAQQSYFQSFFRGVVYGLGSVIGATMVVTFIVYLLRNVNLIPIFGDWLAQIFSHVLETLPQK